MCAVLPIISLGLITVFSIFIKVPKTEALLLPTYDRWTRGNVPTSREEYDSDLDWANNEEAFDNLLIDYLSPPTRQCYGESCFVKQKVRLTLCGSEIKDDCVPVTWDNFVCTSLYTSSGQGHTQQRCRIVPSVPETSENLYEKARAAKSVYEKKWDDDDYKIVPF